MVYKVFIGGLCPKFIICSDWSVNGNGIEWARVWRRFFLMGWGVGVGVRVRDGGARLGRVDKELIGIFTLCFVWGSVASFFMPMNWWRGVACL